MMFGPLEAVTNKFHFGIGGIGDFLLLMSTFYDDVTPHTDVIFVCNNVKTIRELSNQFPKVERFWFFPNKAFFPNKPMWERIVSHEGCMGTGVTPKDFDYVGDWIECGKTNVFDYYGVKAPVDWITKIEPINPKKIVIHPCGGADGNRISRIPQSYIKQIIEKFGSDYDIFLVGSPDDMIEYGGTITIDSELWGARWVNHDFDSQIQCIKSASFFIGVNSWCKTYAALVGVESYIYASRYKQPPEKVYGWHKDPADTVFLDGYGFKDAMELLDEK